MGMGRRYYRGKAAVEAQGTRGQGRAVRAKWEEQVGREVRREPKGPKGPKERGGARLIVLLPSWRWRDMRLRPPRPESLG